MSDRTAPYVTQSWKAASDFLREAEGSDPLEQPRTATHAAYYAMFHAARAVLLSQDGLKAPTSHAGVISRFGQIANDIGDAEMKRAGRMIREGRDARLRADYDTAHHPDADTAAASVSQARSFVKICAAKLGLLPPQDRNSLRRPG